MSYQIRLSAQLDRKYPYSIPNIELRNVRGLSIPQLKQLKKIILIHAKKISMTGNVMMCELVQIVEDFLLQNNKDPIKQKMSSWEQMKVREAEAEKEEKAKQKREKEEMQQYHMDSNIEYSNDGDDLSLTKEDSLRASQVEQEIMRQMEALDAVTIGKKKLRKSNFFDSNITDESNENSDMIASDEIDNARDLYNNDDDDDDDDDDEYNANLSLTGSSRYKTDFTNLGILGKGGGGEVVKVRNRLDRRLYAIKKIVLQSEKGRFAKYGSIENRKLRREVTTISRMTHKNIVRYYQAWVEEGVEFIPSSPDLNNSVNNNTNSSETSTSNTNSNSNSNQKIVSGETTSSNNQYDDSSNQGNNWWQNTPSTGENYSDSDNTFSDTSFESTEDSAERSNSVLTKKGDDEFQVRQSLYV